MSPAKLAPPDCSDGLLLDVPVDGAPLLEQARSRYAKAAQEWDDCREMDNSPIRQRIGAELFAARDALVRLEASESERRG